MRPLDHATSTEQAFAPSLASGQLFVSAQRASQTLAGPSHRDLSEHKHVVVVLALDGVVLPDLTQALGILGRVSAYDVRVCGPSKRVRTEFAELRIEWGLDQLALADTIIVPGREAGDTSSLPPRVRHALRTAFDKGTRLVSICTGAFTLAEAGILDGMRATTHWLAVSDLAARYPHVEVDRNVLFTDNGQVLCSAGAAAGTDLCLHLVLKDLGAAAATDAARMAVAPLMREGHQAQFIKSDMAGTSGRLDPLLEWLRSRLDLPVTVADMARHARMSERTVNRRFKEQTGTTPLGWLQDTRIREAQYLLEASAYSIEEIATRIGFVTSSTLRQRFIRKVGVSPSAYRKAFGGRSSIDNAGR